MWEDIRIIIINKIGTKGTQIQNNLRLLFRLYALVSHITAGLHICWIAESANQQ